MNRWCDHSVETKYFPLCAPIPILRSPGPTLLLSTETECVDVGCKIYMLVDLKMFIWADVERWQYKKQGGREGGSRWKETETERHVHMGTHTHTHTHTD